MTNTRMKKLLADIASHKLRSLLITLTIALGVFALGVVATIALSLVPRIEADFLWRNPRAAILRLANGVDEAGIDRIRALPGVSAAEGRRELVRRLQTADGATCAINLIAMPDVAHSRIDCLVPAAEGARLPSLGDSEVYLERSSAQALGLKTGDTCRLMVSAGSFFPLGIAAIAHDATRESFATEGDATAFTSLATLQTLGAHPGYDQIYLTVSQEAADQTHVAAIAQAAKNALEAHGQTVLDITIPPPGKFPASESTEVVTAILGILGVLCLLLGSFLIVNTVHSLMEQQSRQISVMKAIGARRGQITMLYCGGVLVLGLAAFLLAAPLSLSLGWQVCARIADVLNFDLPPPELSPAILSVQAAAALLMPLAAAWPPIRRNCHLSVHQAMNRYGLASSGTVDSQVTQMGWLSRPTALSLRNAFRRKGRMALTVAALTVGGGVFMAVGNLQASFGQVIGDLRGLLAVDVVLSLDEPFPSGELQRQALSVPGVVQAETWAFSQARFVDPGNPRLSTRVLLIGMPAGSRLYDPLAFGRSVVAGDPDQLFQDQNAIGLSNQLLSRFPGLKVGDRVQVAIRGLVHDFRVVTTHRFLGQISTPFLYVSETYLKRLLDGVDQSRELRLQTDLHDAAGQEKIALAVERRLREKCGIQVSEVSLGATMIARYSTPAGIIGGFLLAMSALVLMVGGFGLMGSMGMNILERTREIGVMRAIGAGSGAIVRMVAIEALAVGLLGGALAIAVAVPVTWLLGNAVGSVMLGSPMDYCFSWVALVAWLCLTLIIALGAALVPALQASRLTVRQTLAYE